MLAVHADIKVVATCGDLPELIEAVERYEPDVVLTDIRMPPGHLDEGVRFASDCRAHHPDVGIILLSQYAQPTYVRALLEEGAERRGYLLKERVADVDELAVAVRTVAAGGSAIDPRVIESLLRSKALGGDNRIERLTARERDVLGAMAQGRTNAAIAESLVVSQRAIEKHINSIFSKLDLSGDQHHHPRVQAVLLYLAERGDR
ncbi:MAG: response regulator transcription factor [Acidimicrobiales bacterium]|nr:response regulator transcription factor [Acidimicrobiales bacterium]